MSTQPKSFLTPEEYLEIERAALEKSEYHDGVMYAMAGTGVKHSEILGNVAGELRQHLRGNKCRPLSDVRLLINPTGLYTYPDIMVVGNPNFVDSVPDMVDNPAVIIEILSPSTEAYDRGKKFESYRALATLQEYVMFAQDRIHVEHFTRQPNGIWAFREASTPDATVELASINCKLSVANAYADVDFNAPLAPPSVTMKEDES